MWLRSRPSSIDWPFLNDKLVYWYQTLLSAEYVRCLNGRHFCIRYDIIFLCFEKKIFHRRMLGSIYLMLVSPGLINNIQTHIHTLENNLWVKKIKSSWDCLDVWDKTIIKSLYTKTVGMHCCQAIFIRLIYILTAYIRKNKE